MIPWSRFAFVAVAAALSVATPSFAAPSRAELDNRLRAAEELIARYEQRLAALEQQSLTGDPAAVRLQSRVDQLETQLRATTGALEQSKFTNQRMREEIRTLRRELQLLGINVSAELASGLSGDVGYGGPMALGPSDDAAFGGPSGDPSVGQSAIFDEPGYSSQAGFSPEAGAFAGAASVTPVAPPVVAAVELPDDPSAALEMARNLLIDGRFAQAEQAFSQFTERFPSSPQMGEALYWQGETHYLRDAFMDARDLYMSSIQKDPRGVRAPDAMVKLAAAMHQLGQDQEACQTLSLFPQQYPNADPAVQAKARRASEAAGCS